MKTLKTPLLTLFSAFSLMVFPSAVHAASPVVISSQDWSTGENLTVDFFDGFAVLRPAVYFNGVVGDSTVSDPGELEVGAHDPYRNGFSLQGLEFSLDLDVGEIFGGNFVYNVFEEEDNNSLDGEFEEIYATADFEGLGLRGGRYLNAFGFQNETHLHGWDFVDMPLVYGIFLGDHGLRTDGLSATFDIPSRWDATLSFSFGESVSHDHDHGEEHGHDEEEEHGEEEHDHDEHSAGEDLLFDGTFASSRLFIPWNQDDFNRWSTHLSLAVGTNAFDKTTIIYATGISYEWLENGYEPGGARFRTSLEIFGRSWTATSGEHSHDEDEDHHDEDEHEEGDDHHDEESEHGGEDHDHDHDGEEITGTDFGFLAEAIYSPSNSWDFGGRLGYVSGDSSADLDERWRVSPAITWWANSSRTVSLRLQGNLDFLPSEEEQSVWLQLGIAWGGH